MVVAAYVTETTAPASAGPATLLYSRVRVSEPDSCSPRNVQPTGLVTTAVLRFVVANSTIASPLWMPAGTVTFATVPLADEDAEAR